MQTSNIEVFNPVLAELQTLKEKYATLEVTDINDEVGYQRLKEADKELVHARTSVNKIGKSERDDTNAYSKAVIELEKKALEITAETEAKVKANIARIDQAKERATRVVELPARRKQMAEVEARELTDDEILDMSYTQFRDFIFAEADAQRLRLVESQKASQKIIDDANFKIENDKRIEQAAKDLAKKKIADQKIADDAKISKEKAAREKQEADAKFQEWLRSYRYTVETQDNFYIMSDGKSATLYSKMGTFNF
jgi:hypothetical protein